MMLLVNKKVARFIQGETMKKYINLSLALLLSALMVFSAAAVNTATAEETTTTAGEATPRKKTRKHPRKKQTKKKKVTQDDEQVAPKRRKKSRKTRQKVAGIRARRAKLVESAETGAPVIEPSATAAQTRTARRAHHMARLAPSLSTADIASAKSEGKVWVNTRTGVYHTGDSKWFGRTKHGKFMTTAEADKSGYSVSKRG